MWLVSQIDAEVRVCTILDEISLSRALYRASCVGNYSLGTEVAVIASAKGFVRPYGDFFRAYLTGTFINDFLPSTIGGDTYRTLWLGRRDGELRPLFQRRFSITLRTLGGNGVSRSFFRSFISRLYLRIPCGSRSCLLFFFFSRLIFFFRFLENRECVRTLFLMFPEKVGLSYSVKW